MPKQPSAAAFVQWLEDLLAQRATIRRLLQDLKRFQILGETSKIEETKTLIEKVVLEPLERTLPNRPFGLADVVSVLPETLSSWHYAGNPGAVFNYPVAGVVVVNEALQLRLLELTASLDWLIARKREQNA